MVSQLLSWLVTFVTLSIIPRALGEKGIGQLSIASTAISIPAAFLLFGIDTYLVKEIGRDPRQAEHLLRAMIGLRTALLIPAAILAMAAMALYGGDHATWKLALLMIPAMWAGMAIIGPTRSALSGFEDARSVGAADLVAPVVTLLMLPLPLHFGAIGAVYSLLIGTAAGAYVQLRWVRRRVRIRPVIDLPLWGKIIRGGMGFFVNNYIQVLYGAATVLLLKRFAGDESVGVMSQAGKLTGTFMFVPTALAAAMLPSISRMADTNPERLQRIKARFMSLLMTLSFPLATSLFLLAGPICRLLYGTVKFTNLPPVLMVAAVTLIPLYFVTTMYQFLVAQNQARVWTYFMLGSVAINVGGCILLIPWSLRAYHNGALGASMAILAAETASTICAFVILRVNPFNTESLGRTLRGVVASAIMGVAMRALLVFLQNAGLGNGTLASAFQVFVPGAAGFLLFSALGWYMRILAPEEQHKLGEMVQRRLRRT